MTKKKLPFVYALTYSEGDNMYRIGPHTGLLVCSADIRDLIPEAIPCLNKRIEADSVCFCVVLEAWLGGKYIASIRLQHDKRNSKTDLHSRQFDYTIWDETVRYPGLSNRLSWACKQLNRLLLAERLQQ